MVKQFFWKIVICVVPVLLSLVIIAGAMMQYFQQVDELRLTDDISLPLARFKLGSDLAGGTILVYEIDMGKLSAQASDSNRPTDAKSITANLAEKLKSRIDPNDLYNVVIRPAGGEGRVEIILPTGSTGTAEKQKEAWDELLRAMETEYKLPSRLKVPRGQVQRLTEKILQLVQQRIWEGELYSTAESKKELMDRAVGSTTVELQDEPEDLRPLAEQLARERGQLAKSAAGAVDSGLAGPFGLSSYLFATIAKSDGLGEGEDKKYVLGAGRMLDHYNPQSKGFFDYSKPLSEIVKAVKDDVDDPRKYREIDGWFKQQAWKKMIGLMLDKWPILQQRRAAFEKIAPDAIDELVGRVECKGDSTGQAFLVVMEALAGKDTATAKAGQGEKQDYILADRFVDQIELDEKNKPKDDRGFLNANQALAFILEKFGPSAQMVESEIERAHKTSGHGRDLTVEEVQRIKDLVSKVGSLEFSILANSVDDKEAIEELEKLLNNPDQAMKAALDDAQISGRPPPTAEEGGTGGQPGAEGKKNKEYTIDLRGNKHKSTYRWVEIGPQARQDLGLHNNAPQESFDPPRSWGSVYWSQLHAKRGQAVKLQSAITEGGERFVWQGALFFSRVCQDRNLPEEERARKKFEYFVLARNPELSPETNEPMAITGDYLTSAQNYPDASGRPAVSFTFNNAGGLLFRDLTRKNIPSGEGRTQIKRHLAIILDSLVMSAPTINSEIERHGQISGSFTNREVDQLVNILRAGALPATLKPQPVSENTMGPTLGVDTTRRGLLAIALAFVAVLVFMIVYYRFAGLVASVALLANLVLTIGFMLAVKATFTLPGLAGLVLMLGMAVDANILIYERLREERERGAGLLLALRNGYDRAFPTIIDTHLSSIFTAIILYIFGNDQLKGFGVSLTLGLLISLFTSLYMTRVMFDFWAAMGWLKKLGMFRFFSRPDIDFMALRYYFFAVTGILTVLGAALFLGRNPPPLNIDFVGGTAYAGQLVQNQAKTDSELRDLLGEKNQIARLKGQAIVKELDDRGHLYLLSFKDDDPKVRPPRTIALANAPEGATPEEREEKVKKRAEELPDAAVELVFLDTEEFRVSRPGASRVFTVRTTEKEPDLVQATLDRLLQFKDKDSGQWEPLLKKVLMEYDEAELLSTGRQTRVRFYEMTPDGKKPTSASPSFVTTLLTRELLKAFGISDRSKLQFGFELASEDEDPSGDGRFRVAELTFSFKAPDMELSEGERAAIKKDQVMKIAEALRNTTTAFYDRPQPERLETFDSQLAAETRLRAVYAILLSWGAILLYLWFRFGSWQFGLAAVLCLVHDLFFTLGIIAGCHYVNMLWPGFLGIQDFKIDLPAVAALLTLVGYSVNDTIVVFDRIREVRGKNPELTPQMINDSVNQTLSRTLLASVTMWLVVIVLYIWGGPGVHLFAFVMVVGVIIGTYSSIYVASPLLLLFGEGSRAQAKAPASTAPGQQTRIQPAVP